MTAWLNAHTMTDQCDSILQLQVAHSNAVTVKLIAMNLQTGR